MSARRTNIPPKPRNAVPAVNPVPGAFGKQRAKTRPHATHTANPSGSKLLRRIAKGVTDLPSEKVPLSDALEIVAGVAKRYPKEPRFPLGDRRNREAQS